MSDSVFNLEFPKTEPAGFWFLRMCIIGQVLSKDFAFTWTDFGNMTKALFPIEPDGYRDEMELSFPLAQLKAHIPALWSELHNPDVVTSSPGACRGWQGNFPNCHARRCGRSSGVTFHVILRRGLPREPRSS